MENNPVPTPEELEKMLEKAKNDLKAALDKMTPEERAQAEIKARKLIDEDNENMQKLIDDASNIAAGNAQEEKRNFCANCGAPVSGGNFCSYCGSPLH